MLSPVMILEYSIIGDSFSAKSAKSNESIHFSSMLNPVSLSFWAGAFCLSPDWLQLLKPVSDYTLGMKLY